MDFKIATASSRRGRVLLVYDLKGLIVLGLNDEEQEVNLGQIHELFETGANDVMVVRATADSIDGEERMIPWHKDVVQRVDLEAGRIYVNWGVDF